MGVRLDQLSKNGKYGTNDGPKGGVGSTLQLLPSDSELDIRVFYDSDFAEVFFMQGRVVMSLGQKEANVRSVENGVFAAYTTVGPALMPRAEAWAVKPIWCHFGGHKPQNGDSGKDSQNGPKGAAPVARPSAFTWS